MPWTWPPASTPWQITRSAPASSAARPAESVPTCQATRQPASCARRTSSGRTSQKKQSEWTLAAKQAESSASSSAGSVP